jgi:hypothetical protein
MAFQLCEAADDVLLREYKLSIQRLESLDPSLPKGAHEIRIKYHDYIGQELARRGLLKLEDEGKSTRGAR